ncbi:MAG: nucleotide exchange factor GrpE [Chloroflexota bacterium]
MHKHRRTHSDEESMSQEQAQQLEASDVEALRDALKQEEAKAEEYLKNWQRTQADFINYKKRTEQQQGETAKFANSMLILNILPVLDDFERAIDNVSTKMAGLTWVEGMNLIYRKLQGVLEASGLTKIEAAGEDFDPNLHEALMTVEGEEGKVIEEVQKGYKLHDRVIRPSLVKVGKSGEQPRGEAQTT